MKNTEKAGGTRFSEGKPGLWAGVPVIGLRLVARVTQYGAEKYSLMDWKAGQSFSTLIDSATRHWLAVLQHGPWSKDEESGIYHMSHCGWNILALLTFMELRRYDLDNVSGWVGVTTAMKQENGFTLENPPEYKGPEGGGTIEAGCVTPGCDCGSTDCPVVGPGEQTSPAPDPDGAIRRWEKAQLPSLRAQSLRLQGKEQEAPASDPEEQLLSWYRKHITRPRPAYDNPAVPEPGLVWNEDGGYFTKPGTP